MILADPKPKRGGRCAECGAHLPQMAVAHDDPFCRTDCAKAWHTRERERLEAEAAAALADAIEAADDE